MTQNIYRADRGKFCDNIISDYTTLPLQIS